MYPLRSVLLGTGAVTDQLGQALTAAGVEIEGRHLDLQSLRKTWPEPPAEPRLLVSVLASEDDLIRFRHTCDALPGWPALVGISGDYDAAALFRVNRCGAAQLLPVPWTAEDLHAGLDRLASQYGLIPRPGKLITVFGVSEAGGAVMLAANLAYEAAETWHLMTFLAEPASPVGAVAELFDIIPAQTTEELYALGQPTREKVRQAATRVTDRLLILPGPRYQLPAPTFTPEQVRGAVEALRRSADAIVVCLPSSPDAFTVELVQQSEETVLVATQQVPSLHALRQAYESLLAHPHAATIHLVVNRYSPDRDGFERSRLKEILHTDEVYTIAEDKEVYQNAVNTGRPFRQIDPNAHCVRDIVTLGTRILGRPPEERGHRGFLSRWFGG